MENTYKFYFFKAKLEIIGVNPFVFVPEKILQKIFLQAGKDKGPIQIKGDINGKTYTQTLVRFQGIWRLYINTKMLPNSPKKVGEIIEISIAFDPISRKITTPKEFEYALLNEPEAKKVFENLSPSRQNEIVRYIANLKSPEVKEKNIKRAILFLLGKGRFVGREKV